MRLIRKYLLRLLPAATLFMLPIVAVIMVICMFCTIGMIGLIFGGFLLIPALMIRLLFRR